MDRRPVIIVLAGVVISVLFVLVATGGEVPLADGPPDFAEPAPSQTPLELPPQITLEVQPGERSPIQIPYIVELVLRIVFYGCVAALVVLLAAYARRSRPRLRWRRRRPRAVDFD
ncbi:MAG: hypothetical protein WBP59_15705, partial [Ilumatobacteraceae bacterium]